MSCDARRPRRLMPKPVAPSARPIVQTNEPRGRPGRGSCFPQGLPAPPDRTGVRLSSARGARPTSALRGRRGAPGGSERLDNDPNGTRYGCFLPDLTGLARRLPAPTSRPRLYPAPRPRSTPQLAPLGPLREAPPQPPATPGHSARGALRRCAGPHRLFFCDTLFRRVPRRSRVVRGCPGPLRISRQADRAGRGVREEAAVVWEARNTFWRPIRDHNPVPVDTDAPGDLERNDRRAARLPGSACLVDASPVARPKNSGSRRPPMRPTSSSFTGRTYSSTPSARSMRPSKTPAAGNDASFSFTTGFSAAPADEPARARRWMTVGDLRDHPCPEVGCRGRTVLRSMARRRRSTTVQSLESP